MIASRAMQRHEKVAERAGTLVTERVRAVLETAQARAERARRDAADEARRLDDQRIQTASRLISQIENVEDALGRVRQRMRAGNAVDGSFVEEDRQISSTAARAEVEDPQDTAEDPPDRAEEPTDVREVDEPSPDPTEAATVTRATPEKSKQAPVEEGSEAEDDPGRSRFSFLRRREPDGATAASGAALGQDQEQTHACVVCGRGFAGAEDELKSLGWVVSGSGEVTCADCSSAGWLSSSG